MRSSVSEEQLARFLRDHLARQSRSPVKRLILACERILAEIVASDDRAERERLRGEYDRAQDLLQARLVIEGFKMVAEASRSGDIESAKHARDAKYGDIREKAVQAVDRLRKANPRMSINAAAKKVGSTLGIPTRTLARWASVR